MSLGRSRCAVVSLSGLILVDGGYDGRAAVDTTEALSPQTMSFSAGPTMLATRAACAVFMLSQGRSPRRTLVLGGFGGTSDLSSSEVLTAVD